MSILNSNGTISISLTITNIIDDNHCTTIDPITKKHYYIGHLYKLNLSSIGNTYPFIIVPRKYASTYKENALGLFIFLYALEPIPVISDISKEPFNFNFLKNSITGEVVEITQTTSNFNNYIMSSRFDITNIPTFKALQTLPFIPENKNTLLIEITVLRGHNFYFICDTAEYGQISLHSSINMISGKKYLVEAIPKYMAIDMGVGTTIPQPPIQKYLLGLNQSSTYTNVIANNTNMLIQCAGMKLTTQNIGATIVGPSYQISYINFLNFHETTKNDTTGYQLFNIFDDFISTSYILLFLRKGIITTAHFPHNLNLNYSLGSYYNFTSHKLNFLISMKMHTDKNINKNKNKNKSKSKPYLLKSILNNNIGIFEKGSKEYYIIFNSFIFGSSSIGKSYYLEFNKIFFMNNINSVTPK